MCALTTKNIQRKDSTDVKIFLLEKFGSKSINITLMKIYNEFNFRRCSKGYISYILIYLIKDNV